MSQPNNPNPDDVSGANKSEAPSNPEGAPKNAGTSALTKLVVGGVVGGFAAAKAFGLLSYAAKAAAPAAAGYLARKLAEHPSEGKSAAAPAPAQAPPAPAPVETPVDETPAEDASAKNAEPSAVEETVEETTEPESEVDAEAESAFFDPFAAGTPNPSISPLAHKPKALAKSEAEEVVAAPKVEEALPKVEPEPVAEIEPEPEPEPEPVAEMEPEPKVEPQPELAPEIESTAPVPLQEEITEPEPEAEDSQLESKDGETLAPNISVLPSLAPLTGFGIAGVAVASAESAFGGDDDENEESVPQESAQEFAHEPLVETEEEDIIESLAASDPFSVSIADADDEPVDDEPADENVDQLVSSIDLPDELTGPEPDIAPESMEENAETAAAQIPKSEFPFPSLTEIEETQDEPAEVEPAVGAVEPAAPVAPAPTANEEKDVFGFLDQNDTTDFVAPPASSASSGGGDWSSGSFSPASSQGSPFLNEDDGADESSPLPTGGDGVSPLWSNPPTPGGGTGVVPGPNPFADPEGIPESAGGMPSEFFDLPESKETTPAGGAVQAFFPDAGPPSEPVIDPPLSPENPDPLPVAAVVPPTEGGSMNLATNPWDDLPHETAPVDEFEGQSESDVPKEAIEPNVPANPTNPTELSKTFPSAAPEPSAFDLPAAFKPNLTAEALSDNSSKSVESAFPATEPPVGESPVQDAAFDPIQVFLGGAEDSDTENEASSPFSPVAKIDVEEKPAERPSYPEPWATPDEEGASAEDDVPTPFVPNPRSNPFAKAGEKNERGKTPEPGGPSPFLNLDKGTAKTDSSPFGQTKKAPIAAAIPFPDEKSPVVKKRSLLLPLSLIGLAAAGAGAGGYFLINAKRSADPVHEDSGATSPPPIVSAENPVKPFEVPAPEPEPEPEPLIKPDDGFVPVTEPPVSPEPEPDPEPPLDPEIPAATPSVPPADPLKATLPDDPGMIDPNDGIQGSELPETVKPAEPVDGGDAASGTGVTIDAGAANSVLPANSEELGQIRIDAEKTIRAFLNAKSIEERILFSHDVDGLKKDMQAYYAVEGRDAGPIATTSVEMKIRGVVPGSRMQTFLYHISTETQPQGFPVSVEETMLGFRVDWEAFVQFNDNLLQKFLADTKSDQGQFYVILRRSHFFGEETPESSNLISYRVISPIATDTETFAFVDKRTVIGEYFDKNFTWGRTYRPVLQLKWEMDVNDKPRVAIAELSRNSWRGK